MKTKQQLQWIILTILGIAFSCSEKPQPYEPTPYTLDIPDYFPTQVNIPEDNPLTEEGVELGRHLFYDGRLSGRTHSDSLMSCATCHIQSQGFDLGLGNERFPDGQPIGLSGVTPPHYPLPLINLIWNENGYLWNGMIHPSGPDQSKTRLEDLVWMGVVAPHEMAGDTNRTKKLIQSIDGYPALFEKAFGTNIVTMENINKAVAQFVRTLISSDAKFDRYMRGEEQLTTEELSGYVLFTTEEGADCFHCHGGAGNPLFTTHLFYNNGKDREFTGAFEDPRDRYHITNDPMDIGAYKATTLRNIALGGPYMHDGRFQTLDEVIDFYAHGLVWSEYINPLMHHIGTDGNQLLPWEKEHLKAFIATLMDTVFLNNPKFAPPVQFPDGTTFESQQ
ncbi:MAG TPA: cytochrome c peroxidase [Bacteroidales bacterium]|nr:cytochrome c peroxidase [Bacteroidales bacterium]